MADESPTPPPVDLAALAAVEVLDCEDDPIAVGDLWLNQKVVLVFLPFLNTPAAGKRAAQVKAQLQSLRSLGAEVYLIGPDDSANAEKLEEALQPGCELFFDPKRRAFRSAGLRQEDPSSKKSSRILKSIKNLLGVNSADLQRGVEYGGVLVLQPQGHLAFAWAATDLEAPLPMQAAEDALKNAGWSHLYR